MKTRNSNCPPLTKSSNDASSPAKLFTAETVAFGQTLRQKLPATGLESHTLDGGGDEDADTGADTTVPDDGNDDIASFTR